MLFNCKRAAEEGEKLHMQSLCAIAHMTSTLQGYIRMKIYNHYRKHWLGAYWQENGITVIPTISWSDKESFDWCFDGEPVGGTVAVSSVGCMNSKAKKELFFAGYKEMINRLQPEKIIFYGTVPDECMGNVVRIRAFQEKLKEVICDGW